MGVTQKYFFIGFHRLSWATPFLADPAPRHLPLLYKQFDYGYSG
jgi:hypothetical protein